MDRRTADATEQWLRSLLQSLDASPSTALAGSSATPAAANIQQRKRSPTSSTHEIRLGVDQRVVTLTFTVKHASAPVRQPVKEEEDEWPWWPMLVLYALGGIVGLVAFCVILVVHGIWLLNFIDMVFHWLHSKGVWGYEGIFVGAAGGGVGAEERRCV